MKILKTKTWVAIISFCSGLFGLIVDGTDLITKIKTNMYLVWNNVPEFWRLIITWTLISLFIYFVLIQASYYKIKIKRKIRRTAIEAVKKTDIEIIKKIVLPKLFENQNDLIGFIIEHDLENKEINFKISDEAIIEIIGEEDFKQLSEMKTTSVGISKILDQLISKIFKK